MLARLSLCEQKEDDSSTRPLERKSVGSETESEDNRKVRKSPTYTFLSSLLLLSAASAPPLN